MLVVGIDPGVHGALALTDGQRVKVVDMPSFILKRGRGNKTEVDPYGLADALRAFGAVTAAFLEQVGAMPKQGVSSTFQFGRAAGMAESTIATLGLPLTKVPPGTWMKAMGVRGGKDGSRARANELLPADAAYFRYAKDHNRAEAALIALYGHRLLTSSGGAISIFD